MAANIRIRMFRPGFGDCFLISFGRAESAKHVLVDFGVHGKGDIGTMAQIMDDLEKITNKKLALIVATHAHQDHISGFGKFAERFSRFKIGEVWRPWLDNPNDHTAAALMKKQVPLYDMIEKHLRAGLGADERNPKYAAALHALENLKGNGPANSGLNRGFGVTDAVRFLEAGQTVDKAAGIAGLTIQVLSPSRDQKFLSRMNPPAGQRYLAGPMVESGEVHPFPKLEIRKGDGDYAEIEGLGQPLLDEVQRERLEQSVEFPAGQLALALDNVRNNTSLVLLFRYAGKALLFPGDAQWGNWQSWIGSDEAHEIVDSLDFVKIAHHGSENATPVEFVDHLRDSGVAAMVPTQVTPFPTIPRKPLLKAVSEHCLSNVVVRSDWIEVEGVPGDTPPNRLPKGFRRDKRWIDYIL